MLLTSACLIGAIAAFGTYLAGTHAAAAERDVEQRARMVAQQLVAGLLNAIVARDFITIERQLLALGGMPNIRDVYVISDSGNVMSHVTAGEAGELRPRFGLGHVSLPAGPDLHQNSVDDRIETWAPIHLNRNIGWIKLVSDLAPIYQTKRAIYLRTALAGMAALLVSLTALFIFLRPRIVALNSITNFVGTLDSNLNRRLQIYRGSSDIEALGRGLRDASERIAADGERLRGRERQLRTVVENMPVLMDAYDEHGHIIVWNKECERVTGYTAAQMIGNPCAMEMLYPDPLYRETVIKEARYLGSQFRDWALELTTKRGLKRTIAWSNISAEFPISGWATWRIGVDITKTVENDRLKDEFVSTVNHELRTPLTAVLGSLRLISSTMITTVPEPARDLIVLAERNCDRLSHLINNVLHIQRLQKEASVMDVKRVDTPRLLAAVVAANQPFAREYKVTLRLARVAVADSDTLGDHDKLEQVLTNLISNAIKFSPTGETVDVSLDHDVENIRISIRDRGPGISEEFSQKIFQHFARAHDGSASRVGGSGLGLYISRSIIDQHHGRIDFENNADVGTTFHVVLPAAHPHVAAKHSGALRPGAIARG